MIVRTLDEALETRIQEKRTHVRALNTAIRITDSVRGLGEAVMNEDYSALRGELLRLISLSESLLAIVAGCEDSLALPSVQEGNISGRKHRADGRCQYCHEYN